MPVNRPAASRGRRWRVICRPRVDTASPGDKTAVGGAAPATSPMSYDRCTSYSRHSGPHWSPCDCLAPVSVSTPASGDRLLMLHCCRWAPAWHSRFEGLQAAAGLKADVGHLRVIQMASGCACAPAGSIHLAVLSSAVELLSRGRRERLAERRLAASSPRSSCNSNCPQASSARRRSSK